MSLPLTWVTAFLDLPAPGYDEAEAFWLRALEGRLSPRRGDFVTVLPAAGDPYVRLQRVYEGSGVHLDLHVPRVDQAVDEAVALGAALRSSEPGLVVLTSPGGFSFCVTAGEGERVVPPLLEGLGGARRLEQVALDIPPRLYDREVAFWAGLTGWGLESEDSPEFRFLPRPPGIPLRLLLQRLDDDDQARVTAHLDFACADRDRLTPVHEAFGARFRRRFEGWTQLEAPGGHVYCLTTRPPG